MRTTLTVSLCGAALVALVALAQTNPPPAQTTEPSAEAPPVVEPIVVPAKEQGRKNPLLPTEENLARGYELFGSQCAMCHGKTGAGDGELTAKYNLLTPDLRDPKTQDARSDGELFYIVTTGHGMMPGQGGRLTDEHRWSMVLAIRSMRRQAAR